MSRQQNNPGKKGYGGGKWAGATRGDGNAGSRPAPHLPAPCLAAASRPHSRTPWSARVRSSAAISVPASEHAGNGGRTGPNFRRGRSPPLAVGGPPIGRTRTQRSVRPRPHPETRRSRSPPRPATPRPTTPRPFQSVDSARFCVHLCPKPETGS